MNFSPLHMAFQLPIWWTRAYTFGLPLELREARRDEIASDLYEQFDQEAAVRPRLSLAVDVAWAVVRGVPHDLMWRSGLLTVGWWLVEAVGLMVGMSFCCVLGTLNTLYITGLLGGLPSIVLGVCLGATLGLWCAITLRRHRPLDLSLPEPLPAATVFPEGDLPMPRTFRTWAGVSAIFAAFIQFAVVAGYASGGDINPYSEPAAFLGDVDSNGIAWSFVTLGTIAIPLFLVPMFVVLATDAGTAARQWGVLSVVLVAIHCTINAVAYSAAWLLIPLANDYVSATAAEQVSLLQQADLLQSAWMAMRVIGGVPFMMAMFVAAVMCFRTRLFPRWMGVVAIILGLQFAPPVGGEFILVPPAMALWALGTGFILLRRSAPTSESTSVVSMSPLPAGNS